MKKLVIILLAITVYTQVEAQRIEVGIKGSGNSTWLFNNHVSNAAAAKQSYVPSFGYNYGVSGTIYFNKKLGFQMEFLYSEHNQKYTGDDLDYESQVSLNEIDIPFLFKFKSETDAFFELGAIYSRIVKATYQYEDATFKIPVTNIDSTFSKSSVDGLFGIGVDIEMGGGFAITTAMRFWGSISDLKGVDAYGNDLSNQAVLDNKLDPRYNYEGRYEPTHSVAAGFLIGLTYSIGKKDEKKD